MIPETIQSEASSATYFLQRAGSKGPVFVTVHFRDLMERTLAAQLTAVARTRSASAQHPDGVMSCPVCHGDLLTWKTIGDVLMIRCRSNGCVRFTAFSKWVKPQ